MLLLERQAVLLESFLNRVEVHKIMDVDIDMLNMKFKSEFEKNKDKLSFEKYVMSELLSPIEDFENAVKIIRNNYATVLDFNLLIIGAYLIIAWTNDDNEILRLLNNIVNSTSNRERAIIHYLNAYSSYYNCLKCNQIDEVIFELKKSIIEDVPFVNNRYLLAQVSPVKEAKGYYAEAIENAQKVFSDEEIAELSTDYFLDPKVFIDEFILGTTMTMYRYNEIKKKWHETR